MADHIRPMDTYISKSGTHCDHSENQENVINDFVNWFSSLSKIVTCLFLEDSK